MFGGLARVWEKQQPLPRFSTTQHFSPSRLKSNVTEMPLVEEERRPDLRLIEREGYKCAGCKFIFTSLRSLNHHRGHRSNRGTTCEDEESAKELRNIYSNNLPAGLTRERPVFQPCTNLVYWVVVFVVIVVLVVFGSIEGYVLSSIKKPAS